MGRVDGGSSRPVADRARARDIGAQALDAVDALPAELRPALPSRLDTVRQLGHDLGYGVGIEIDDLLARRG